jgi:hypothetical protein
MFMGKILTFNVKSTDKIIDIKNLIEQDENIPINQQRLTFICKQLEDKNTIEFYNIKNEDTLYLHIRLIDG